MPSREAAAYAIQLSLIEVDRAANTRRGRDSHWRAAEGALRSLPAQRDASDAWLLLRLQSGLNLTMRGELEQATGDRAAASTLVTAGRRLVEVADEIESLRRRASETFNERELDSLANRTTIARARAERLLAISHPAGSADRDDALLQAAQSAADVASRNVAPELRWQARLLLIECERLLGKAQAALTRLDSPLWVDPPQPPAAAGAIAAERWRLLTTLGREQEAARVLAAQPNTNRSPELTLARIEAQTNRWQSEAGAAKEKTAARIQQALVRLREAHGGLWAARAERIAGDALAVSADGGSVDAIITTAEYLFRAERLDEAIDAYDRAAGTAYRDGATGRAFELSRTAAAIVRSQGDAAGAADRLRRASLAAAQRPDAAATHRLAILSAAEAIKSSRATQADRKRYGQLLREHTRTWPDAPSAAEARWWLVKWRVADGDWRAAIRPLAAVPPDDPRYEQAIRLLGEAFTALHEQVEADPAKRQALLDEATASLQPVITGADNRWPQAWSTQQRETALVLARLHGGEYARRLLTAALDSPPAPTDAAWRDQALLTLVPALIHADQTDTARQRLAKTPIATADHAAALLTELGNRLPSAAGDKQGVAELMLDVIRRAPAGDNEGRWKAPHAAVALAALGRTDQAIKAYEQLLAQRPRDARLRLELAGLLASTGDAELAEQAAEQFATVEQGVPQGAGAWWDARLGRLQALAAAGRTEKARKLLRLTKVLHPDLDGRREAFEALGLDTTQQE